MASLQSTDFKPSLSTISFVSNTASGYYKNSPVTIIRTSCYSQRHFRKQRLDFQQKKTFFGPQPVGYIYENDCFYKVYKFFSRINLAEYLKKNTCSYKNRFSIIQSIATCIHKLHYWHNCHYKELKTESFCFSHLYYQVCFSPQSQSNIFYIYSEKEKQDNLYSFGQILYEICDLKSKQKRNTVTDGYHRLYMRCKRGEIVDIDEILYELEIIYHNQWIIQTSFRDHVKNNDMDLALIAMNNISDWKIQKVDNPNQEFRVAKFRLKLYLENLLTALEANRLLLVEKILTVFFYFVFPAHCNFLTKLYCLETSIEFFFRSQHIHLSILSNARQMCASLYRAAKRSIENQGWASSLPVLEWDDLWSGPEAWIQMHTRLNLSNIEVNANEEYSQKASISLFPYQEKIRTMSQKNGALLLPLDNTNQQLIITKKISLPKKSLAYPHFSFAVRIPKSFCIQPQLQL